MPLATDIISLAEAKDFLNITTPTSDTELGNFISAASQAWINRVGPVAGSPSYDEWYDGGGRKIVLRHAPVQSITSITEAYTDSVAYTLTNDPLDGTGTAGAYGYTIEKDTGILVRRATGVPISFARGLRNVHVVYVAGYATVPADVKEAVLALLKHGWETQRGVPRRPGTGGDVSPQGYMGLWPARAQDIANAQPTYVPGIS